MSESADDERYVSGDERHISYETMRGLWELEEAKMARVHDLIDDLGLDSIEDLSVENVRNAVRADDAAATAIDYGPSMTKGEWAKRFGMSDSDFRRKRNAGIIRTQPHTGQRIFVHPDDVRDFDSRAIAKRENA